MVHHPDDHPPSWSQLVKRVRELNADRAPLEGYLFHGTSSIRAEQIVSEGLQTREIMDPALLEDYSKGVFLGTPRMAAYFAEDQAASDQESGYTRSRPVLIAISDDVATMWPLVPDYAMVRSPTGPLAGIDDDELERAFNATDRNINDALRVIGSVISLDPFHPDDLTVLQRPEDVDPLISPNPGVSPSV